MTDRADLVLTFQIAEGRSPDAVNAVEALVAWIDVMRSSVAAIDPLTPFRIDLIGVEEGSQRFKFALRRAEEFGADLLSGMDEFPLAKKAALTLGGLIASTAVIVGATDVLTPDPRIPDDQMQVFTETRDLLQESVELQRRQERFYEILQNEPAYDSIDVLGADEIPIAYTIPRSEFAARSGLWQDEAPLSYRSEPREAVWEVVLIKPVLIPEPRRWRFARDGLEFSAMMEDEAVLDAIHNRTLRIRLAEGEMMKVEVRYRETFDGKVWLPVSGSHKIKRVLYPAPANAPTPLFPDTDAP